jgi:alpha-L-arabinofuranosidase
VIDTHWGGDVENNHFGTHEFMDLCDQLGARPPHLRQRWRRRCAGMAE